MTELDQSLTILESTRSVANLLTDEVALDIATHFTCAEAVVVGEFLRLVKGAEAQQYWIDAHAQGDDDPGDAHHDIYLATAL